MQKFHCNQKGFNPGKIHLDNGDGTFDVQFDDGIRCSAVLKSDIKSCGCSALGKLRVGDKVKARYEGSCKFSTRYKSSLKRHLIVQHDAVLGEKKDCELCNLQFFRAIDYNSHRKKIHPTEEEIALKLLG